MTTTFTDGCACGAIRYECSADSPQSINCHCPDCQRASGSAYASALVVPAADLRITKGTATFYSVKADSDRTASRGFCSQCGSPVLGKIAEMPELAVITAASLDDPSTHKPTADFFTSRAQPWDFMNPELPKFETEPDQ